MFKKKHLIKFLNIENNVTIINFDTIYATYYKTINFRYKNKNFV